MKRLPGDGRVSKKVESMIRVNHAGEYGAKRIYEGQLAVLGKTACAPTLQHMAEQESVHLEYFDKMIVSNRIRPTALMPLWHVAGYALGVGSALLGEKAAMACTVAVENVIEQHYQKQSEQLSDDNSELKNVIDKFRMEEIEHHNIAIDHQAEQSPFYVPVSVGVKAASKLAIWLSERI